MTKGMMLGLGGLLAGCAAMLALLAVTLWRGREELPGGYRLYSDGHVILLSDANNHGPIGCRIGDTTLGITYSADYIAVCQGHSGARPEYLLLDVHSQMVSRFSSENEINREVVRRAHPPLTPMRDPYRVVVHRL